MNFASISETRLGSQVLLSLTIALFLLPLVSLAQSADLTIKNKFTNGKQTSFRFEFRRGMIFVPVRLNQSQALSFVLDTGSTRMIVDRSVANRLGFKRNGQGSLQGAGAGRVPIEFVENLTIGLPGLESTGYEFSSADLQPLESSLGTKVDGILGYELFRRFVVTVDYESTILAITLPEAFHAVRPAEVLPIELREKWAFVKGQLDFPGSVTVQDTFLIDSGSGDAVDHPIAAKLQSRIATQTGVGLGNSVEGALAQATSFQLGKYAVPSPTVSCCGATDQTSKLIGNDVLKFFTITFDYPATRIFITPNSALSKQSSK